MAFKKRSESDLEKEAAIEAFGDAAERPNDAEPVRAAGRPAVRPATTTRTPKKVPAPAVTPAAEWPEDIAKTLLIRYPDLELPALLVEVARFEERSQHATAVRALRRGLEILKNEANY
jgi:hypothetical protein